MRKVIIVAQLALAVLWSLSVKAVEEGEKTATEKKSAYLTLGGSDSRMDATEYKTSDGFRYMVNDMGQPVGARGVPLRPDDILLNQSGEAILVKDLLLRNRKLLGSESAAKKSQKEAPPDGQKASKQLDFKSSSGSMRYCKYTSNDILGDGVAFSSAVAGCAQEKFQVRAIECIDDKVGRINFEVGCFGKGGTETSADDCVTQTKDKLAKGAVLTVEPAAQKGAQ